MTDEVSALLAATAGVFNALVFARAAWHKISDFSAFTGFVADYQLLSEAQVKPASVALVAVEVAIPVALLVPGTQAVGAVLAFGLLSLYAAAIGINLARGRTEIECGCGGAPNLLSPVLVVRNVLLAAFAALVLFGDALQLSFGGAAVVVSLGFLLFACFLLSEQILSNGIRARTVRSR